MRQSEKGLQLLTAAHGRGECLPVHKRGAGASGRRAARQGTIFAAESAKFLAEHIELITAAIVAYAAYQAVFLFVQLADAIKKAVAAMAALNVTMAANPIGAIAALIGLAAGALTYFALTSDKATEATERQNSVLDENRRLLQEVASLQGRVTSNNVDQLRGNLLNLEGEYQKLQAEQDKLREKTSQITRVYGTT